MSNQRCCVQGCLMSRGKKSSMFGFPKSPTSKKIWKDTLRITKSTNVSKLFVCSRHFDKSSFKGTNKKRTLMRLKSLTVPTLNLPYNFERPTIEFIDENTFIDDTETFSDSVERDPFEIISPEFTKTNGRVTIKKQKNHSRRCIVPSCNGSKGINNISLHKFPDNEEELLKWKKELNIMHSKIGKNTRVCSNHFNATDFSKTQTTRNILKRNVIPTLTPRMSCMATLASEITIPESMGTDYKINK